MSPRSSRSPISSYLSTTPMTRQPTNRQFIAYSLSSRSITMQPTRKYSSIQCTFSLQMSTPRRMDRMRPQEVSLVKMLSSSSRAISRNREDLARGGSGSTRPSVKPRAYGQDLSQKGFTSFSGAVLGCGCGCSDCSSNSDMNTLGRVQITKSMSRAVPYLPSQSSVMLPNMMPSPSAMLTARLPASSPSRHPTFIAMPRAHTPSRLDRFWAVVMAAARLSRAISCILVRRRGTGASSVRNRNRGSAHEGAGCRKWVSELMLTVMSTRFAYGIKQ